MSAQPKHAAPGGSGLFQGQPLLFSALEDLASDLDYVMKEAISNALLVARSDLRSSARHQDGWSAIADTLDVEWDGDGFVYFSTGDQGIANSLEYGDEVRAPTGFLRKTAIKQAPVLANIVSATISEVLYA